MKTQEAALPADRWSLTLLDRVTVDGAEWCVYFDERYTWAIRAEDWDAETDETDYSLWCSETRGAGDRELCAKILAECEVWVSVIYTCGGCEPIERD